jgi:hypothetical protein
LPTYRVHFTWKGKELELSARSLDLTHPYFVSIKDLLLPQGPKLIINPAEDDMMKFFGKAKHLMIPFQTVQLIEELPDEAPEPSRVRSFTIIEGNQKPGGKNTGKKIDPKPKKS